MGIKTRRQIKEEIIKKAYFEYWRIQNNPEYVAFYNEIKADPKKGQQRMIYDPPIFEGETKNEWIKRVKKGKETPWWIFNKRRFGLNIFLGWVNPFKKIDWENLKTIKNLDDEIISLVTEFSNIFKPIFNAPFVYNRTEEEIRKEQKEYFFGPYGHIVIDYRADKKEILEALLKKIDEEREQREIKVISRDSINKFHLYAQIWDLRKGQDRTPFLRIARMMETNISTIKSRFYRAFELIFNQPYDPELFKKSKIVTRKEALRRYCGICDERETCKRKDVCPDVIQYTYQDWKERDLRYEVLASERNPKVMADLGYSK